MVKKKIKKLNKNTVEMPADIRDGNMNKFKKIIKKKSKTINRKFKSKNAV